MKLLNICAEIIIFTLYHINVNVFFSKNILDRRLKNLYSGVSGVKKLLKSTVLMVA
jgi:hypothetical protein